MLDALLRRGYFPRELPPLFRTDTFADVMRQEGHQLPACFTEAKPTWTNHTPHNLARIGGLRRRLSTPNPLSFFRVANAFDANGSRLAAGWAQSPYSHTRPAVGGSGVRGIAPSDQDRASARSNVRVGARYLLRADIAQFYPSVYTHTIPWAAHTKEVAKAKKKDLKLYGNVLDRELSACQQGQTKGIPIGPDTSLGIAELVLSDVDRQVAATCRVHRGVRFIDDMEYTFQRLADAEDALCRLEGVLSEYELQLNAGKTGIVELPDRIESAYVSRLRPLVPTDGSRVSQSHWIDFFNHAFLLSKEHPGDGVLRYATGCLKGVPVKKECWDLIQGLLWQCVGGDPGCLRFVIDALLFNTQQNAPLEVDKPLAQVALDALIARSAPIGHGSEVLWSIWGGLLLGLELSNESAMAISSMEDSFVAVAASLALERGVIRHLATGKVWEHWFEPGCFVNPHWLFVYEASRQGWLPEGIARADLDHEPACTYLRENGVSFLDANMVDGYRPGGSDWWVGY